MKSLLVDLWLRSYDDCHRMGSYAGATRDKKTFLSRVEKEGISFLTITLPSFCRDFERSLADGRVTPSLFQGFRKSGRIPAFLQGIFCRVFDTSGSLLDCPDVKAIAHMRQLTLMFKKLKLECSAKRNAEAIHTFKQVEVEIAEREQYVDDIFRDTARRLWSTIGFDQSTLRPKFGPGAVSERLSLVERRRFPTWTARLERSFPFYGTGLCVRAAEEVGTVTLDQDLEYPSRVILVPKTLKGPRVIAAEPASLQFCQQSLLDYLMGILRDVSRGVIRIDDQSRNQRLASNVANATIDLSAASDRLSLQLAKYTFESCPGFLQAMLDCRTEKSELPSGEVITLRKFASMGSALCFPVQSMVFMTIVLSAIRKSRPSWTFERAFRKLSRTSSIYGDDIIVPVEYARAVVDELEAFGLKVNRDKSFWTGKFRESCGADYYDGELVTPTYITYTYTARDVRTLASWTAQANKFYSRGYHDVAFFMASKVKRKLPLVSNENLIGFTFSGEEITRYNKDYQCIDRCAYVLVERTRPINLDGWHGLSDWFHRSLRAGDTRLLRTPDRKTSPKIKKVWIR